MIDDLDFGYADGSVPCTLPDMRYAFALTLGALVIVAALAIAAVQKIRHSKQ